MKKIPNSVDLISFPRTVIYCNSIRDVSKLYCYITSELSDSVFFYEMFHSETPDAKKEKNWMTFVMKMGYCDQCPWNGDIYNWYKQCNTLKCSEAVSENNSGDWPCRSGWDSSSCFTPLQFIPFKKSKARGEGCLQFTNS